MVLINNMNLSDFDYLLPKELIANYATEQRSKSRLLVPNFELNPHKYNDLVFSDIIDYLEPNDLLILNNSKVIKARLFGNKITGGKIEVMIERIIDNHHIIAHVRSNKTIQIGMQILLPNDLTVTVDSFHDGLFKLSKKDDTDFYEYLEKYGNLPLPPYINRATQKLDEDRYQTIYAKYSGSVAAPTAGLHFDEQLIEKIKQKGVKIAYITLHVGSGTFKPVCVEKISEHKMHSEVYHIEQSIIDMIKCCKKAGNKIIAVGTTTLRSLESNALTKFTPGYHETDIFITPGFKFKVVDKLITNFHLPKSTLLMLVSAFAGIDQIKNLYQYAIEHKYRFFSYGDAMLLTLNNKEQMNA